MIQSKILVDISNEEINASEELIEFMKVISESNRFKIIQLLYKNTEISVSDISVFLNISQPAVSQHLKILKLTNIVKIRKNGRYMCYSLDNIGIEKIYGNGINYLKKYFNNI